MFCSRSDDVPGIEDSRGLRNANWNQPFRPLFADRALVAQTTKICRASGFNARIVIVSSLAHEQGEIRFDDLNWNTKGSYSAMRAYQQSKYATFCFVYDQNVPA